MRQNFLSLSILLIVVLFFPNCASKESRKVENRTEIPFNDDWLFSFDINDNESWSMVELPHTPVIEPLIVNNQWQGVCWYKKQISLDKKYKDKKLFVKFEGAMQVADVWLNDQHLITHKGGYLPFTVDLTQEYNWEGENTLIVKLVNVNDSLIPPGKPLETLDFNYYGGIYRKVHCAIRYRGPRLRPHAKPLPLARPFPPRQPFRFHA